MSYVGNINQQTLDMEGPSKNEKLMQCQWCEIFN